jgi:hypothetical protein
MLIETIAFMNSYHNNYLYYCLFLFLRQRTFISMITWYRVCKHHKAVVDLPEVFGNGFRIESLFVILSFRGVINVCHTKVLLHGHWQAHVCFFSCFLHIRLFVAGLFRNHGIVL